MIFFLENDLGLISFFSCVLWDSTRVLLGGSLGSLFFWDLVKNSLVTHVQAHTGEYGVRTWVYFQPRIFTHFDYRCGHRHLLQ